MSSKTSNDVHLCCGCGQGSLFWGIVFLIVGAYLLAIQLGWVNRGFPFWPLFLIIAGAYLLLKYNKK
jgi:hypothetical protein